MDDDTEPGGGVQRAFREARQELIVAEGLVRERSDDGLELDPGLLGRWNAARRALMVQWRRLTGADEAPPRGRLSEETVRQHRVRWGKNHDHADPPDIDYSTCPEGSVAWRLSRGITGAGGQEASVVPREEGAQPPGGGSPPLACVLGHNCDAGLLRGLAYGAWDGPANDVAAPFIGEARARALRRAGWRDRQVAGALPELVEAFAVGSEIGDVERLTARFREERALDLGGRAIERGRELAAAGEAVAWAYEAAGRVRGSGGDGGRVIEDAAAAEARARRSVRWFQDRARGQVARFEALLHCDEGAVSAECTSCGTVTGCAVGCGVARLCVRCRDHRASRRRDVVARSIAQVVGPMAAKAGLSRANRPGGRYSEKHLTLTLPHALVDGPGAVEARIDAMFKSWRTFSQLIGRHFRGRGSCALRREGRAWCCERCGERWGRKRDAPKRCSCGVSLRPSGERWWYHRGFEWTPGADGQGHPHFHVWIYSGYLERDLLRMWWAAALGKALGREVDPAELVLSISEVRVRAVSIVREVVKGADTIRVTERRVRVEGAGGADLVQYVEGWSVVDVDPVTGRRVGAEVIARVFCELEGRRQVQASRGFLGLGWVPLACACCGVVAPRRAVVTPWWRDGLADMRVSVGLQRAGPGPGVSKVALKQVRQMLLGGLA